MTYISSWTLTPFQRSCFQAFNNPNQLVLAEASKHPFYFSQPDFFAKCYRSTSSTKSKSKTVAF